MLKQESIKTLCASASLRLAAKWRRLALAVSIVLLAAAAALAQTAATINGKPIDLSISGIRLGDRASAKKFLSEYQFGQEGDAAVYHFYNSRATSVLKLTAADARDPYFLTSLEVFAVTDAYQGRHFVAKEIGTFQTESGIFVGFRQSGKGVALALLVGVPNVSRDNMIGPKDVIGIKGEPTERMTEGDAERFVYKLSGITVPDAPGKAFDYTAQYVFRNKKLKRFSISIQP
jgi:hypothetical protein